MTVSEKKTIGSITTQMAKKTFNERTISKSVKFSKCEGSESLVRMLREKRLNKSNPSMDKFISTGMTYDSLDVCVKTLPGIGELQRKILYGQGIEKVSDLVDMFFKIEEDGVRGAYDLFETWLKCIGISLQSETITMCISSKWYMLMTKSQWSMESQKIITKTSNHLAKNVGGILTIGLCSCLLLF